LARIGLHGPPAPPGPLAKLVPLLLPGHRGFCIPKMSWGWFMLWVCYNKRIFIPQCAICRVGKTCLNRKIVSSRL
jgi:hypothetical protein